MKNFGVLINRLLGRYEETSYSQEGEDLLLHRTLEKKLEGFYIDIGAHHPFRFSNSYYFYKMGWKGICVDANPDTAVLFRQYRPKDLFIETGIGNTESKLSYFRFNDPALNTFDPDRKNEIEKIERYHLTETKTVSVQTLSSLFSQHWPSGKTVDFLSIDIEGFDLPALQSNNWELYRPKLIALEDDHLDLQNLNQSELHRFMTTQGYHLISKLCKSAIYQDMRHT